MSIDWAAIREKLPTDKTDDEQKEKRSQIFDQFDPNGNGYLSLAEVDKGFRDVLGLYDIFDAKKVIMRSFQAAKSVSNNQGKPSIHGPDYIERSEFRLLLVYIRQYFELWQMMSDVSGPDHRISQEEFITTAVPKISTWGFPIEDPAAEFSKIDTNGGGYILFEEFANWALVKHLDLETDDD